jgi:uncharacterized protein YbjT (DUF2867 family)
LIEHRLEDWLQKHKLILVTGGTGYIAGRLIPCLLARGYLVRCLVRDSSRVQNRSWFFQVEVIEGDIVSCETLEQVLEGVSAAYYLIHNMTSGKHYHERDISAAHNFALAASAAGLEQIIYLGGLADPEAKIGFHLRSRLLTGETLRQGNVPVTEFRAGPIIGAGSISFEMIRFLTEQFPLLLGPRWVHNLTQPIAVQNVLDYLLDSLEIPASHNRIFEIGGANVLTYAETMLVYANLRGLKRRLLTLPAMSLRLMSVIVDKLTPVPANIASPLIDGMRSDSVVHDNTVRQVFPHIQPLDYRTAVTSTLNQLSPAELEPIWEDGGNPVKIIKHAGFFIEHRQIKVDGSPDMVYHVVIGLGGKHGWLYLNWLWRLRGLLDRIVGGPGMRGRRVESDLKIGDIVDFYRVDALDPNRRIRLRAELKAPGDGWMEWRIKPLPEGGALLSQLAFFAPRGVFGFFYWYVLNPVHRLVFAGMIKRIAHQASRS